MKKSEIFEKITFELFELRKKHLYPNVHKTMLMLWRRWRLSKSRAAKLKNPCSATISVRPFREPLRDRQPDETVYCNGLLYNGSHLGHLMRGTAKDSSDLLYDPTPKTCA